jgi:hypothetical protein
MATSVHLFEEYAEIEAVGRVLIESHIEVHDQEPKLSVFFSIEDRKAGQIILRQKFDFVATNPIWLAQIDPPTAIAGAYSLCVANKLLHATYDQVAKCYNDISAKNPDASLKEKISMTAECVGANSQSLKQEVKKALKECLTLGLAAGP